ncbi:hypothetical protein CK203_116821 [Vitis vinifera]|uniref:Glycosyl transferase family 28 C-terminal domain-containing protein n=1 Tax=Vitis vinifera TaxID=29760 RepID=A0A438F022_VITVI|nr:hypothetical protein CK203_116821 [Vitis vinifera]
MGDTDDYIKPVRTVFVTVGTTCFDALVKAVDTHEFKRELFARGYTHLLIQMGRGSYIPTKNPDHFNAMSFQTCGLINMENSSICFESCPSLAKINILTNFFTMQSTGEDGSLVVDFFTFSSSIADNLRSASLVISHAGNTLLL